MNVLDAAFLSSVSLFRKQKQTEGDGKRCRIKHKPVQLLERFSLLSSVLLYCGFSFFWVNVKTNTIKRVPGDGG